MKYTMPLRELCDLVRREHGDVIDLLSLPAETAPRSAAARLSSSQVRRVLTSLGFPFPRLTIAFMNLKGGVGKTTSAVTIASRAVQYGFSTCILDMDAQGGATLALGVALEEGDLIFNDIRQDPAGMVTEAVVDIEENLSIVPSDLENSLLDVGMMNPAVQKKAVREACDALHADRFDLVIIDCPPSLGAGVISTICAADVIVIPVGSDAFSFRGIELSLEEIGVIRETFGIEDVTLRILLTCVDRRLTLAARAQEKLTEAYPQYLLPGVIRTSTEFSKALENRETVFASSRKSNAREDYDTVTRALLGLDLFFREDGEGKEEFMEETDNG
ncbi:ParA family protein [Planctomycetota bacterium]